MEVPFGELHNGGGSGWQQPILKGNGVLGQGPRGRPRPGKPPGGAQEFAGIALARFRCCSSGLG
eukprot:4997930-Alexandrium_andersonii.AAC.1